MLLISGLMSIHEGRIDSGQGDASDPVGHSQRVGARGAEGRDISAVR